MKCISIKQPWAWAIFHGKPVENRTWKTDYRGDLLIHASRNFDFDGLEWMNKNMLPVHFTHDHPVFVAGAIIGKVIMTDCVIAHSSPWFFGPYGHVYTNHVEFTKPIPFKGALKFFEVPDEILKGENL
jgi:hypothetical protein